jgi:hypothetical protein
VFDLVRITLRLFAAFLVFLPLESVWEFLG